MLQSLSAIRGVRVAAKDGNLGRVEDILFDAGIWAVRYIEVATQLEVDEDRRLLLPAGEIRQADWERAVLRFDLTREQAAQSPRLIDDRPVSRQEEERLHSFFGWQPYWTDADPPSGPEMPIPEGDEMTGDRQAESVPDERLPVGDPNLYSAQDVVDYQVEADGGLAGKVNDLIVDDETWMIRYLVIDTGDDTGEKQVLLASQLVDRVSFDTFSVYADVSVEAVKAGPGYDPSVPIDAEFEEHLQNYFGY